MDTQRAIVLIDGSNLYHRFKEIGITNLLHFDFVEFLNRFCKDATCLQITYYVGVIRTEPNNQKSYELFRQQRILFSHLEKQGVAIYRGFLLKTDGTYHEKGVDVMIATHLLAGAFRDQYDTAILVSSDSDLIPAIEEVQSIGKTVHYMGFHHTPSYALLKACKRSLLLTKEDVSSFVRS